MDHIYGTPAVNINGRQVRKSIKLQGDGATTLDLFSVTGSVNIISLCMVATTVTDATTLQLVKFETDDETAQVALTGAVLSSGIVEGAIWCKDNAAAQPLVLDDPTAALVSEPLAGEHMFYPARVVQKTGGVTTVIRVSFTGDANTDVDVIVTIEYKALAPNSGIQAV
jgi:hypothetical protein